MAKQIEVHNPTLATLLESMTEDKLIQVIHTGIKAIEYRTKYSKSEKAKVWRQQYGAKQRASMRLLKEKVLNGEIELSEEEMETLGMDE